MFLKIGEIDTLKEQYEADVLIQSKWREPALDKDKVQNNQIIEWADYWNPKLFIENTIGDPRENAFQVNILLFIIYGVISLAKIANLVFSMFL